VNLLNVVLFGLACSEYDIKSTIDKSLQGESEDEGAFESEEGLPEAVNEEQADVEEATDEGIPSATERMYLHTSNILYSWAENGSITTIGQFYLENDFAPNITDLAIDLSGNMYAVSNENLYRVDPTDARLEYICETGEYLVGLTFLADGRLLAAGESILWMDPNTCARAVFVETGRYETSGDIVGLPDGNLYWTVIGGDALVRVDPITGQTEYVGEIGSTNLWGVGYFNDVLYGFSSSGTIVHIDPDTAAILHEENTSGQYWWGAATNPVHW
jgi:hypothetical protein